jgi:helicase
VVIAFSGHGTETHELVAHDTDPRDIARRAISLTTLGELCSRIPSRRLLIVLDCCFSGGMGAKALQRSVLVQSDHPRKDLLKWPASLEIAR